MELKLRWFDSIGGNNMFQSYLYGIEILRQLACRQKHTKSFNRTFMELKLNQLNPKEFQDLVSIVPLWNWNSDGEHFNVNPFRVSIVPLWNWNIRWSTMQKRVVWFQSYLYGIEINLQKTNPLLYRAFQSYLYGIEIQIYYSHFKIYNVSIVPLWNWNVLLNQVKHSLHLVSIVPLWNWNTRGGLHGEEKGQFQSYLYGIEIKSQVQ